MLRAIIAVILVAHSQGAASSQDHGKCASDKAQMLQSRLDAVIESDESDGGMMFQLGLKRNPSPEVALGQKEPQLSPKLELLQSGPAQPMVVNITVINMPGESLRQPQDVGGAQPPVVNSNMINPSGESINQPQDVVEDVVASMEPQDVGGAQDVVEDVVAKMEPQDVGGAPPPGLNSNVINPFVESISQPQDVGDAQPLVVNSSVINPFGESISQPQDVGVRMEPKDVGVAQPRFVDDRWINPSGESISQPQDVVVRMEPQDVGVAQPPVVNTNVINPSGESINQPQDVGVRMELPSCAVATQPLSELDDSDRMNSDYFFLSDIWSKSDIAGSSGVTCLQRLVASPPVLDWSDLEPFGPWRDCLWAAVRYEHLVDWAHDARFAKCSRNGVEYQPSGPAGQVIDLFTERVEAALLALEDGMDANETAEGHDHPTKLLQATTRFKAAASYLQLQVTGA